MSVLKEHISALKEFLRNAEFRRNLLSALLGLVIFILMGFISYLTNSAMGDELIAQFLDMVTESGIVDGETGKVSVFMLLQNNWTAMLIIILYGLIPFIQFPVISLFSNGVLLGVMGGLYWLSDDFTMSLFLASLLPHAVFELTALVFAAACGMYLCRNMTRLIRRKDDSPNMTEVFSDLLRVLLFLIAPLVVAAAFIEVYITPVIQGFFL